MLQIDKPGCLFRLQIGKTYYQQGALEFRELIRFDAPPDWNILDPVVG